MPPFQSPQTMIREDFVRIVLAGLVQGKFPTGCPIHSRAPAPPDPEVNLG
jgi:hypothetical protein